MALQFGPRRATYANVTEGRPAGDDVLSADALRHFEAFDRLYRGLCAMLYNYVPMSGHPGGSISSGRIVQALAFETLDYDVSRPDRDDADVLSYAAGHKAMGLYALLALRDEIVRLGRPGFLPDVRQRLRLEDLLGFRRNPTTRTPLFLSLHAKALDGHPTPATPFVRLATGASGVGVSASVGLAWALRDSFGAAAPRVHVLEGEGGLTPGRVAEALAAAGTASLDNLVLHLDWNQASIDSDHVCRDDGAAGDYVQWSPRELFYLHDWNVIDVPEGRDFRQVLQAQRLAATLANGQPTAIVYRTVKGWQYGIEGRSSHGAGHKLCSEGFHVALHDVTAQVSGMALPCCEEGHKRCEAPGVDGRDILEECLWQALTLTRTALEQDRALVQAFADRLAAARERLDRRARRARADAPQIDKAYALAGAHKTRIPDELRLAPGASTTLRNELGRALQHLNRESGGAFMIAAADLLGSTTVNVGAAGFPAGYWHATRNPGARLLSVGGICEDAIAGVLSGLSAGGRHVGVGSSYAAFLAPLGHVAARLHAIGNQARRAVSGEHYRPMILVCAHAGLKTGEDGPTHADPQALQLVQGNFPGGTSITLTPWEPQEIWPLLCAALGHRPALVFPFVTRPNETVLDRTALDLARPEEAVTGVYLLRKPRRGGHGTIVLQESAVTYTFVQEVLPLLDRDGLSPWVYYVASAELFDLLPAEEQERIFPEERAQEAMGITGFTRPTMDRWVRSGLGRTLTMHPYQHGAYLGSGRGEMVLAEAGLDGPSQYRVVRQYIDTLTARARRSEPEPAAAHR
jgi:transketolase